MLTLWSVAEGESRFTLELAPPDFGSERVDDLFKRLGPLAVFSAKQHWSAPRLVLLQQTSQASSDSSISSSYGFTVSTDCPVVVTSVQQNSLAHVSPQALVNPCSPAVLSNDPLFQFGGIREGDFIVAIDDRDVKWSSHEDVVKLIKASRERLSIKIVTPMDSNYLKV